MTDLGIFTISVWNRDTRVYDQKQVQILVDAPALAKAVGAKAFSNKARQTKLQEGAVIIKAL